jgi:endonuclease I
LKKIIILILLATLAIAAIPDGYYNNASGLSGTALKTALHGIIDGHTEFSYDYLKTALPQTDEDPNNSSNLVLIYTGRSISKSLWYPHWNREHSWPKSHGDFGDSPPAGTDMHHLRPSDVDVNGVRGNKDYDNGGSLVSGTSDCYTDGDSFEPRDEVKGDCARMMFYMTVRYEGGGEPDLELVDRNTGTSEPNLGKLSTLLAWHVADPVDDWERRRNDRVYSYQNNRNPFIDHPEYVSYIFGGETPGGISAPVAALASNVDSSSFTANWSSVSDADGYKIYVAEDVSFSTFVSGYDPKIVTAMNENITGLAPETDYYYKLKAYDSSEESDYSNIVTVQTLEGGGGTVTPPDTGDGHTETFANFSETGSSYLSGLFVGLDGSSWTYDNCRGDIKITDETPCLGKDRNPMSSVTSGTITGGIVELSFQYKQAFSTNVSLDVLVNDVKLATVTSDNEIGVIKNSGSISVNVSGDAVIKFLQTSGTGQVAIDNITWTSPVVSVEPVLPHTFHVGDAYPNPFNPRCTLPLELTYDTYTEISLLDVLGNERQHIFSGTMSAGTHQIDIDGSDLSTGLYFVLVKHQSTNVMRKILLIK